MNEKRNLVYAFHFKIGSFGIGDKLALKEHCFIKGLPKNYYCKKPLIAMGPFLWVQHYSGPSQAAHQGTEGNCFG